MSRFGDRGHLLDAQIPWHAALHTFEDESGAYVLHLVDLVVPCQSSSTFYQVLRPFLGRWYRMILPLRTWELLSNSLEVRHWGSILTGIFHFLRRRLGWLFCLHSEHPS